MDENINLELLTKQEAIDIETAFPQVHAIWPSPRSIKEMMFYTGDWAIDPESTGKIFFIYLNKRKIGITGYFLKQVSLDTAGLRWHGLIPKMRGSGYSRQAIALLAKHIMSAEPSRKYLSEAVPVHRQDVFQYFKSLGFSEWDDPEKAVDYADVHNLRVELSNLASS